MEQRCARVTAETRRGDASMSKPVRLVQQAAHAAEFHCPLCAGTHAFYIFGNVQFRIYRCAGCALTFSQRLSRVTADAYGATASRKLAARGEAHHRALISAVEAAAFTGPVLVIANPADDVVQFIERRGVRVGRVVGPEDCGTPDWGGPYAGTIITDALMQVADPRAVLTKIARSLHPGAPLVLSMPLHDSYQARFMGRNWHEWQVWNRWYFSRETLNLLLLSANFEKIWFKAEQRRHSLDSLVKRMHDAAVDAFWLRGVKTVQRISPKKIGRIKFPLPSGRTVVTAVSTAPKSECVISIIVPVFNEGATIKAMMDGLIAKKLPGLRKEIIIVESNSTDGSREIACAYEQQPDVIVILQPTPRGKGNAVREGLRSASGDIVMIQDADLEYDFDDYDGLLAPLLAWQTMFILGSRHEGGWKIRKFNDAPVTAMIFNFGHWFFKSLINLVLGTQMSDPFTMFKLFRRDALFGVDLVCNRFDLDIELVIKLVRKGYVPIELPVNYNARSFADGKKVSFSQDGLTWLWTIFRQRFTPLGPGPS
jgi:glycosyl transferase family 2